MSRDKLEDLIATVREHVEEGRYRLTAHARERMEQRRVTLPELSYALRHGWHEKRKDSYEEPYSAWSYAVRGQTIDERRLRIIVSFDGDMLVVTVVDLDSDE